MVEPFQTTAVMHGMCGLLNKGLLDKMNDDNEHQLCLSFAFFQPMNHEGCKTDDGNEHWKIHSCFAFLHNLLRHQHANGNFQ